MILYDGDSDSSIKLRYSFGGHPRAISGPQTTRFAIFQLVKSNASRFSNLSARNIAHSRFVHGDLVALAYEAPCGRR